MADVHEAITGTQLAGTPNYAGPLRIAFTCDWYRIETGTILDWFSEHQIASLLQQLRRPQ